MSYSLLETGEGEGEVRMQGRENVKCQCGVHMRACNFSCGGRGRPSGEGSSGITDGRKLGAEQSRHLLCARSYRRAQRSQEEKAELGTCVRSDGEETRSERQAWAQHGGPERGWLTLC